MVWTMNICMTRNVSLSHVVLSEGRLVRWNDEMSKFEKGVGWRTTAYISRVLDLERILKTREHKHFLSSSC